MREKTLSEMSSRIGQIVPARLQAPSHSHAGQYPGQQIRMAIRSNLKRQSLALTETTSFNAYDFWSGMPKL